MTSLTPLDKKHPAYKSIRLFEKKEGTCDPQNLLMSKDISQKSWELFSSLEDKYVKETRRRIFMTVYDEMEEWEKLSVANVAVEGCQ